MTCKQPLHSKQAVFEYLNKPEHGLKIEREINKIKATLTYRPWQLVAANFKPSATELRNIKRKFYFVFALSLNGKEVLRQLPSDLYSEMVEVFAFRMSPLIAIIPDEGKPVAVEDCLFQQTYGMGGENEFLLVFDNSKLENAHSLKIIIKEFGLNTGNLMFPINTNDIKSIPEIIL